MATVPEPSAQFTWKPVGGQQNREFLQRISVLVWAVIATIVVSLLLRLPAVVITFEALGSPISLTISDTTLMAAFLAVLVASGTENVIRTHPRFRSADQPILWRIWPFWALPAALCILAILLIPLISIPILQALSVLASGALLTLVLFSLYATVDSHTTGFRRARFLLNLLVYAAALVLFLLLYSTRTRSLLSGTLVAATATLLAIEPLRSTTSRVDRVLAYALLIGMILGEVTWALNYWLLPGLTGSLLLLLIFYLLVGLAQQGLQDQLSRRVVLEFGFFALLALILIAVLGPGF